jgi:hypothetical protein
MAHHKQSRAKDKPRPASLPKEHHERMKDISLASAMAMISNSFSKAVPLSHSISPYRISKATDKTPYDKYGFQYPKTTMLLRNQVQ